MHTIPESSDNALNIDPMRYSDLKANCLHAVVIETTGGSYCRRCGQWFSVEQTYEKSKTAETLAPRLVACSVCYVTTVRHGLCSVCAQQQIVKNDDERKGGL